MFYLTQYSISNLNAFVILVAIGYTVYPFINKEFGEKEQKALTEKKTIHLYNLQVN